MNYDIDSENIARPRVSVDSKWFLVVMCPNGTDHKRSFLLEANNKANAKSRALAMSGKHPEGKWDVIDIAKLSTKEKKLLDATLELISSRRRLERRLVEATDGRDPCEGCGKRFFIEDMNLDSGGNLFCPSCYRRLANSPDRAGA